MLLQISTEFIEFTDIQICERTMNRPFVQIGSEIRKMNDVEYSQWKLDQEKAQAQQEALEAKLAAKESAKAKLSALGLTEEEINAMLEL